MRTQAFLHFYGSNQLLKIQRKIAFFLCIILWNGSVHLLMINVFKKTLIIYTMKKLSRKKPLFSLAFMKKNMFQMFPTLKILLEKLIWVFFPLKRRPRIEFYNFFFIFTLWLIWRFFLGKILIFYLVITKQKSPRWNVPESSHSHSFLGIWEAWSSKVAIT